MTTSATNKLLEAAFLSGNEMMERYPERQFFGFTCSYWPEELVMAAGMEPLRLFPGTVNAIPAELPSFSCSLARGVLAELKGAGLKKLAGLGLAQTCDTMQCLGSIAESGLGHKVQVLVPPVLLAAPGAREYYQGELRNLWHKLLELSGKEPEPEEVAGALALYGKIRQLVLELDKMRPYLPSQFTAAIVRAGQLMPREEYSSLLEEALASLAEYEDKESDRIGILLSGPVLERDSLYLMIEELGGRVLVDDTCTGTRHFVEPGFTGRDDNSGMTVEAMLEEVVFRYLAMPSCPCRHRHLDERPDYILKQALDAGVQGAILVIRKFCEPHAFDAVPIARVLNQQGIKTLVLELEGPEVGGQERTRLQAFLESID